MKQLNKFKSIVLGEAPIYEANDGKPIEELVIRHKNLFFMIDIDAESGEPTGDFGWSKDTPMTHVPIREHYTTMRNEE